MGRRKRRRRSHTRTDSRADTTYVPTDEEVEIAIRKSKWGQSILTRFPQDAHKNTLITYVKERGYFEMLDNLAELLEKANVCLTCSDSDLSSLVILSLFGRTRGSLFAAIRLATSGQLTECYAQLRVCIENALYASYIRSDPALAHVWGDRHLNDEKRKECRHSFKISSMLKTIESQSEALARRVKEDYDTCIDFGAHPNERSVLPNLQMTEEGPVRLYLLNLDPGVFGACLLAVVRVGLSAVGIFQNVYLSEFKKINVRERVQSIQDQYDRIAPGVVAALRHSTLEGGKPG